MPKPPMDRPWMTRSVSWDPVADAVLIDVELERLIPAIFTERWSASTDTSKAMTTIGRLIDQPWDARYWYSTASDLAYFECGRHENSGATNRLLSAERLVFGGMRYDSTRGAIVGRAHQSERPSLDLVEQACELTSALQDLRNSWESYLDAVSPGYARPGDGELSARERATSEVAVHFVPNLIDRLQQAVRVTEPKLRRRLMRLAQRSQHGEFAAVFEAHIRNLGIAPAVDGRYVAYQCLAIDSSTGVLVVEFEPRSQPDGVEEAFAAASHVLPEEFSKRRSGCRPPTFDDAPTNGSFVVVKGTLPAAPDEEARARTERAPQNRREGDTQSGEGPLKVLEGEVRQSGFEAIAWYQAYHSWDDESWGIYFDLQKMDVLVHELRREVQGHCRSPAALASFVLMRVVGAHELFHARVEQLATMHELLHRKPRYAPYKQRVYDSLRMTADWLEEALANFEASVEVDVALREFDPQNTLSVELRQTVRAFVERWLDFSPPGYSDWRAGRAPAAANLLATQVAQGTIRPRTGALPLADAFHAFPWHFSADQVPAHFVGSSPIIDALSAPPPFAAQFVDDSGKQFQKALGRLSQRLVAEWNDVKAGLCRGLLTPGRDFKLWERGADGSVNSVRLDRNFRAHIRSVAAERKWIALDVGSHVAMGHG